MRRVRSWALSALAAIVVLCGANTALALDIELEAGDAPGNGSTAGAINNAFNGKYYMSGGKIYQVNYVYDNLALNYDIVHTEVTTPQSVINLITNRTDNTYEGSSTGGGTTAMSNAGSNSVSMSDAQSNISSSIDMTPNIGGGNSLEITAGNQSAGTISVGQGNITINNSAGNTTIGGTITTSQGSSNWTVGGGTVSGSLVAGTTGTGDTMTVTNTEFTATGEIRAESNNNSITVGNGSSFLNGSEILSTGTENRVRIEGNANMETGSLITMTGGRSYLDLYLGSGTTNEAKTLVNSTITLNGGYNTLSVGNNSEISNATTISITGANNTFNFHDWSRFDADWNLADNYHTLNLTEAADFDGTMNFTGSGITANINLTYDNTNLFPAPNMTGQIVFETAAGAPDVANTVNISSGTLTNANGSVIASNVVDTTFNVSGGLSNLLVSGAGAASTYNITGGNVYNIRQRDGDLLTPTWSTDYLGKDAVDASTIQHDVIYGDGGQTGTTRFQSYSILNVDKLTTTSTGAGSTGAKTIVSIGGFKRDVTMGDTIFNQDADTYTVDDHGNAWGQDSYGNQVTADSITVEQNSKLIIHADETHLGVLDSAIADDEKSIANATAVSGELTLDRSSLHSDARDGSATIEVMDKGILYGFGENAYNFSGTYANHADQYEQQRAQLYGNLTLNTGATLQPYDMGLSPYYYKGGLIDPAKADDGLFNNWDYNTWGNQHRGSVFRVDAEGGNGGLTTFNSGSIMRSRLFHGLDGREVSLLGERDNALPNSPKPADVLDTQYSDSLLSLDVDFSDVLNDVTTTTGWTAQYNKVQYDPVFGFQYDLKSKKEFEIYLDNDLARLHQDKTYYFAVVNSETPIEELDGYNDANHLFNKLILKSDMLGKYDFLKSGDNQSIYLRYRQLAYHPTEGGIKRTMTEGLNRNEIVPGQYLDEIRYPFRGQPGSDLNGVLSVDPSEDVVGDGYNEAGYNGDMRDFYHHATRAPGDPEYDATLYNPVFDNYRPEWIDDWANLFQGMQLGVADNADMHRAVQMLHAETYANISQTAFDVLNQFTRNRERNAVSALFQVEKEFREEAMARIDGEAGSGKAYASLAEFDPRDFYVQNPIRFWASAFGAHGDQSANSGGHNEMAYDNIVWGGSVGAVKELGDYYLGATLGYADATAKYHSANVNSKSYIAEGLVGARIFCLGFAEAYASYSFNDHKNVRVVDLASNQLGGYHGVATGDFASHVFGGGLRVGYQKTIGQNWLLIPTLGVNVMHHRGANFTESGRWDMANRMVFDKDGMNRTTVRVPVEVRLSRAIALGDVMLMPEVRAGITPLLGDKQGEATAKWVGNPIDNRYFTSYGADRGSFEGWVGATVELSKKGRFYAAANYDYIYGKKYGAHNYSIQAGINF